jgi:6-phospho-3-hexuloisomerase
MKRNKSITIQDKVDLIMTELEYVLNEIDNYQVKLFIKDILKAKKIVVCGAGRVGMAARGFAMRLGHLGLTAYTVGDSTLPSIGKKDLLIACSGSGETQTIYDLVVRAKETGTRIALVSSYIDHNKSRMARLADTVLVINAPSKTKKISGFSSEQPMTTLNEQSLQLFFDAFVLLLMEEMDETHDTMWNRHSILE